MSDVPPGWYGGAFGGCIRAEVRNSQLGKPELVAVEVGRLGQRAECGIDLLPDAAKSFAQDILKKVESIQAAEERSRELRPEGS
jgi:hypothetical protein